VHGAFDRLHLSIYKAAILSTDCTDSDFPHCELAFLVGSFRTSVYYELCSIFIWNLQYVCYIRSN